MDLYDLFQENVEVLILILSRIIGIFAFNPILSRRNLPVMVKIITCLIISVIVFEVRSPELLSDDIGTVEYLFMIIREGFIGLIIGFVTDMFFYSIQMAGEIMDMQAGLGMAKVFDPESNMQMSIMGSLVSILMYLLFFVTNAHLAYIEIFVISFDIIPLGKWELSPELGMVLVKYFTTILTLVLKIAMPIIVSQLILQFCVGVLMKSVPQIQIMIINIQLKVGFGFMILFIVAVPLSNFIDKYIGIWLGTIEGMLPLIPASV